MATILVIDDDAGVRGFLQAALIQAGHKVITAENGIDGIHAVRTAIPDLVLCDIFMPEMEGLQTIAQIRQEYPGLPVIAMSGGSRTVGDFLPVAAKLGACSTLQKPIAATTLIETVCRTLQSQES